MASVTTNVSNTIPLFFEGEQHNLVICLRDGYPILPSETRQELFRETLKTWMYAWQAHLHKNDVSKYKSADDNLGISFSQSDPYVTIYNKDYGFSITVQDSSTPQEALNLATDFMSAIETIKAKVPALFEMQQAPVKTTPKEPIQFPSGDNAPRENENSADVLDSGETVSFRASKTVGNDYMIESGKRDSVAWKEVTKATKPYDRSKVEHSDGELVAYFVNAPLTVKAPNGKVCMEVGTSGGKFTFWQSKRDSEEQTFDWQSIETQMYGVNVLAEQLTDGFKLNMPCLLIVKFTHSGGKEYANFYGFRALPQKQAIAS